METSRLTFVRIFLDSIRVGTDSDKYNAVASATAGAPALPSD